MITYNIRTLFIATGIVAILCAVIAIPRIAQHRLEQAISLLDKNRVRAGGSYSNGYQINIYALPLTDAECRTLAAIPSIPLLTLDGQSIGEDFTLLGLPTTLKNVASLRLHDAHADTELMAEIGRRFPCASRIVIDAVSMSEGSSRNIGELASVECLTLTDPRPDNIELTEGLQSLTKLTLEVGPDESTHARVSVSSLPLVRELKIVAHGPITIAQMPGLKDAEIVAASTYGSGPEPINNVIVRIAQRSSV